MISGSKILYNSLIKNGITQVFGYSGGAILGVLNEFYGQDKIKFTMSRTELGAGFMAEGYAKSTLKPGVVMTTSGPGALNTITSLQNALSDGTPILVLSGQVATNVLGTQAFQEADVINITKPCTKWNKQIKDVTLIDVTVDTAFRYMLNKRHGPVLLDLPKDIMSKQVPFHWIDDRFLKGIKKNEKNYHLSNVKSQILDFNISHYELIGLLNKSKKPVILAGQGILQGGSIEYLRKFVKMHNIPITTTLLGLGIFDERDPLSLKMLGMHGSYYANKAVHNCDMLINFGSRFDDRITSNPNNFAPNATIVHIDISKENINKTIKSNYYINADCYKVLEFLLNYERDTYIPMCHKFKEWNQQIAEWKKIDFNYTKNTNILQGAHVISTLNNLIHKDKKNFYTIIADVGANQMWTAQFIDYNFPKVKLITSGGLGSMGFALPASIGAKVGNPDDKIICISGDGGFTMTMNEILTAVDNKINIKVIIINNNYQLMVKMWQEMFYEKRIIGTYMKNPSFEKVCESMGCKSFRIDNSEDLEKGLQEMLDYEDGPIVVNVITDENERVLPMVCPGKSLDEMILEYNENKIEGDAPC